MATRPLPFYIIILYNVCFSPKKPIRRYNDIIVMNFSKKNSNKGENISKPNEMLHESSAKIIIQLYGHNYIPFIVKKSTLLTKY